MDNLTENFIDHEQIIDDLNQDTDGFNTSGDVSTPQRYNMFDQQIIDDLNCDTDGLNTSSSVY